MSSEKTLRVITHLEAVPGTEEESKSLLLELAQQSRQETGCLKYELLQNNFNAAEFTLVSEWESKDAFQAHLYSKSVEELFMEDSDLLAKAPDIRQYHVLKPRLV